MTRRLASGGVPNKPNSKDGNQGCGDAEDYLQYGVYLHDVGMCATIGGVVKWVPFEGDEMGSSPCVAPNAMCLCL